MTSSFVNLNQILVSNFRSENSKTRGEFNAFVIVCRCYSIFIGNIYERAGNGARLFQTTSSCSIEY